ncbi:hypothetical protein B0G93_113100 [Bacillus sp. V-88]|nr:hypothetical protein B0G93_113100 [Bacillus sp. V-88]SLK23549.1 hypothetical protein SAMN06295884_113100 [Bacillus sp. V-88]
MISRMKRNTISSFDFFIVFLDRKIKNGTYYERGSFRALLVEYPPEVFLSWGVFHREARFVCKALV